jgi:CheY-like chemotaxis protein/two-component sensor histidine kinase
LRSSHDVSGKRILVVEDGLIMARDIERRLHAMGYGVAGVVASGDEAVRMAMHVHPDLVLMDVNLRGGMDGIQTAQKIRSVVDIPVVYVTAYSDDATLERARATDPFGYVLKPFEEKELRTTIEMALYRHGLDKRLRESELRYRALSELTSSYAYSVLISPEGDVSVEWVTEAFGRLTGAEPGALTRYMEYVHPDDAAVLAHREKQLLAGLTVVVEYRLKLVNGTYRWIRDHAHPAPRKEKHDPVRVTGSVQDISHDKNAQSLAEEGDRLRASRDASVGAHVVAQGKRVLMLLDSRGTPAVLKNEPAGEIAERLRDLIHIQSLVYGGSKAPGALLGKHLKSVVADAFRYMGASRLTYTVDAAHMEVGAEASADVLLIANELVYHGLRHSMPSGRKGVIHVSVGCQENGDLILEVKDDNPASGKDNELRKPKTPGMRFLHELVMRLNGRAEVEKGEQTVFRIRIPATSLVG